MGNTGTKESSGESTPTSLSSPFPSRKSSSGGDGDKNKASESKQMQLTSREKDKREEDDREKEVGNVEESEELAEGGDDGEREPFDPDNYDPSKFGPILPNGEINWECPCLGGAASGPCGTEFRAAFSCFHFSKEEPKGGDCFPAFESMHLCFSKYPDLYKSRGDDDDDEDEDEDEQVHFDEEEQKVIDDENEQEAKGKEKSNKEKENNEENEKNKTKPFSPEPKQRKEPLIPPPKQAAVL